MTMIKYLMHRILLIEDKESMSNMLAETLRPEGYQVDIASAGDKGIEMMNVGGHDLILTDLRLPGADGITILKAAKNIDPLLPVIVMTAFGSIETAVDAMKEGAFDFITKPFNPDHLLMLIRRAIETRRVLTENIMLREELSESRGFEAIIGESKGIRDVMDKVRRAAPRKTTILLMGESGTGKELFARAIHKLSDRENGPFVAVNCAAIPENLLESELFGHEKGAFSGADARKIGKFEVASTGTIFLDEIGELSMGLQAKLLRVLQEDEIDRLGYTKPIKIDTRVVAASNKDLEQAVRNGQFREDLFYRINVFPIIIPPLRDRQGDIEPLARHFLEKYAKKFGSPVKEITPQTLSVLASYGWKGNVRELENTIERAVILSDSGSVDLEHMALSGMMDSSCADSSQEGVSLEALSRSAARRAETWAIRRALEKHGGNKTRAAEELQVSYKTLLTKIKDYKIQ